MSHDDYEESQYGPEHEDKAPEMGVNEAWAANLKRLFDEFMQESLESVRRSRDYGGRVLANHEGNDNAMREIGKQAIQNAVVTTDMVAKQAVRHGDLAIDRQWNVDEVSGLSAKTGVQSDAMVTTLAIAIAKALASLETE